MVDFKLHALYLFFIVSVCQTDIHQSIFLSYCYGGCLSLCLSNCSFIFLSIYYCMSHAFFPSPYHLVIASVCLSVLLSNSSFIFPSIYYCMSDCHTPVHLSMTLSLSICLSIQLFLYLSIHLLLYVWLSCVCLSFYHLVDVSICLSVHSTVPFIFPSICSSMFDCHASFRLSIVFLMYLTVFLSVYSTVPSSFHPYIPVCLTVIHLSIYLTSCRNVYLSFCPFNYSLSLHLSVCPCIFPLLVRPSVPPFMCLSVRLSFHLQL